MTVERPNYTQVPNIVIENLDQLGHAELKCILAIIRKTAGWHKESDCLSISSLVLLTGLSNRSVISACSALENRGWITREKKPHPKGFTYEYKLKLKPVEKTDTCKKFTRAKSSHVKKVHGTSEVSSRRKGEISSHTKETLLKETIQKKDPPYPPQGESAVAEMGRADIDFNHNLSRSAIAKLKAEDLQPFYDAWLEFKPDVFLPYASGRITQKAVRGLKRFLNDCREDGEVTKPLIVFGYSLQQCHFEKWVLDGCDLMLDQFLTNDKPITYARKWKAKLKQGKVKNSSARDWRSHDFSNHPKKDEWLEWLEDHGWSQFFCFDDKTNLECPEKTAFRAWAAKNMSQEVTA
jgi:phage replication O-like protein O